MSLFEVKVSYWGSDEIGATKKFREFYLVDAVSCTDAEARIRAELDGAKDLSVQSVKELKSTFLENDEEEGYIYKAKVSRLSIDEKTAGRLRRFPPPTSGPRIFRMHLRLHAKVSTPVT